MKVVTIGRSPQNDIVYNDSSVSKYHLQIIKHDDGSFELIDFNSTNGTFVNGQRVKQVKLNTNDVIKIGTSKPLKWKNYFKNETAENQEIINKKEPITSPDKNIDFTPIPNKKTENLNSISKEKLNQKLKENKNLNTVFLISYFAGFFIYLVSLFVTMFGEKNLSAISVVASIISSLLLLTSLVLHLIMLYRAWDNIKDANFTISSTPQKAVGFLFIPFFNLYWMFIAYYNLFKETNRFTNSKIANESVALFTLISLLIPIWNFISIIMLPILNNEIYKISNNVLKFKNKQSKN
ncbi:MAG: FHA domain-containing protein [Bacteroidales bacterium]|nr:FHA domain-containing protein [Bacteroidales bacterium]